MWCKPARSAPLVCWAGGQRSEPPPELGPRPFAGLHAGDSAAALQPGRRATAFHLGHPAVTLRPRDPTVALRLGHRVRTLVPGRSAVSAHPGRRTTAFRPGHPDPCRHAPQPPSPDAGRPSGSGGPPVRPARRLSWLAVGLLLLGGCRGDAGPSREALQEQVRLLRSQVEQLRGQLEQQRRVAAEQLQEQRRLAEQQAAQWQRRVAELQLQLADLQRRNRVLEESLRQGRLLQSVSGRTGWTVSAVLGLFLLMLAGLVVLLAARRRLEARAAEPPHRPLDARPAGLPRKEQKEVPACPRNGP